MILCKITKITYLIEAGEEIMNRENKEIADILRKEVKQLQSDRLIKLESERKLEQRLMVGRQRIREVINPVSYTHLVLHFLNFAVCRYPVPPSSSPVLSPLCPGLFVRLSVLQGSCAGTLALG